MKNISQKFFAAIDEIKKSLQSTKNIDIRRLDAVRRKVLYEFQKTISAIEKKKNRVREAIRRRKTLRKYKISLWRTLSFFQFRFLLAAPFIYGMIVPTVFLHIFLEIYQQTVFRLCHIPRVRHRDHFFFDRRYLAYLNVLEKVNCCYCSYYNGLISYAREIGGKTERYWCPIKHAKRVWDPHGEYEHFFEYLDAEGYRKNRVKLRIFHAEGEDGGRGQN